jgi:hypothetical protein
MNHDIVHKEKFFSLHPQHIHSRFIEMKKGKKNSQKLFSSVLAFKPLRPKKQKAALIAWEVREEKKFCDIPKSAFLIA